MKPMKHSSFRSFFCLSQQRTFFEMSPKDYLSILDGKIFFFQNNTPFISPGPQRSIRKRSHLLRLQNLLNDYSSNNRL